MRIRVYRRIINPTARYWAFQWPAELADQSPVLEAGRELLSRERPGQVAIIRTSWELLAVMVCQQITDTDGGVRAGYNETTLYPSLWCVIPVNLAEVIETVHPSLFSGLYELELE